uniref:Nectin cell adhesion molecule 2 n=1 Tax=Balaenoptera musculus TaxID=9771 RepID=A0A8C0DN05_BALMU
MARDAALPPSKLSPPKLPLLLLLLLLLRETGAQDVRVRAAAEVRGHLGDTVELPCHLLPPAPEIRVSQVTWLRLDAPEGNQNVAIFHPLYGPSFPSPKPGKERLSFVNAGQSTGAGQGTELEVRDATLALRGLTVEDEGNYTCEFATFPRGTSRGVTWLRVIAQPQNHAETQEVTLSLDPVPVARCVSTGGRPPARVSWLSSLDGEARESQVSGPLPGTVTVTSRFTLVPLGQADGVKVTCKVEHESFEEPVLLPVTLSVRYPPEVSISGYDDNWYVGRSEASLNCDVRSKPEPTGYDWSTRLPSLSSSPGPQADRPLGGPALQHHLHLHRHQRRGHGPRRAGGPSSRHPPGLAPRRGSSGMGGWWGDTAGAAASGWGVLGLHPAEGEEKEEESRRRRRRQRRRVLRSENSENLPNPGWGLRWRHGEGLGEPISSTCIAFHSRCGDTAVTRAELALPSRMCSQQRE